MREKKESGVISEFLARTVRDGGIAQLGKGRGSTGDAVIQGRAGGYHAEPCRTLRQDSEATWVRVSEKNPSGPCHLKQILD